MLRLHLCKEVRELESSPDWGNDKDAVAHFDLDRRSFGQVGAPDDVPGQSQRQAVTPFGD
jgi:hypothetical protein